MGIYLGVGDTSHDVSEIYVGVENTPRQVKEIYIGNEEESPESVYTSSNAEPFYICQNGSRFNIGWSIIVDDRYYNSQSSYVATSTRYISYNSTYGLAIRSYNWNDNWAVLTDFMDLTGYSTIDFIIYTQRYDSSGNSCVTAEAGICSNTPSYVYYTYRAQRCDGYSPTYTYDISSTISSLTRRSFSLDISPYSGNYRLYLRSGSGGYPQDWTLNYFYTIYVS